MEPTNRELKLMLDNQTEKFVEKIDDVMRITRETRDSVKEIVLQTTKTNGRVTQSEINIKELNWWKKSFVWGLGAVWTLIILLAPIVYFIMKDQIKRTVDNSLQSYFDKYEIQIK